MVIRKVDSNQAEIVAALREVGATVQPIHEIGAGCPDLLVGYHGYNYLIEVKVPGSERHLTRLEAEWLGQWEGQAAIAATPEQALDIIGAAWRPEWRDVYLAMHKADAQAAP